MAIDSFELWNATRTVSHNLGQLDLRVLAHTAGCPDLIRALSSGLGSATFFLFEGQQKISAWHITQGKRWSAQLICTNVRLLLLLQCCTSDSALRQVLTCTPTPQCRCDPWGQKMWGEQCRFRLEGINGTCESASHGESELQVPSPSRGYRCWEDLPGGGTTQKFLGYPGTWCNLCILLQGLQLHGFLKTRSVKWAMSITFWIPKTFKHRLQRSLHL